MATTDETRERLLRAAGEVFAEKGFQSATVREICAKADANVAAVNYYFGDKARLYHESVKRAHACRMNDVPLPVWGPTTPATTRLGDFIRTLLARMLYDEHHPSPWQTELMLREMLHPTAACAEWVRDYIGPQFAILLGILGELLPADVPLDKRRRLAFSIVGQCLYYRVAGSVVTLLTPQEDRAAYRPEQLAEHILDVTLATIAAWRGAAVEEASA